MTSCEKEEKTMSHCEKRRDVMRKEEKGRRYHGKRR